VKFVAHKLAVVVVSFLYFSLLIIIQTMPHNYHWYAIALTRQHIATFSVLISSLLYFGPAFGLSQSRQVKLFKLMLRRVSTFG
jgi:hypothetical protein